MKSTIDVHIPGPHRTLGSDLPPGLQQEALNSFVHRFTKEHRPGWSMHFTSPVQFESDKDWLAHTYFTMDNGKLSRECHSEPTWPDNPELINGAAWCNQAANKPKFNDEQEFESMAEAEAFKAGVEHANDEALTVVGIEKRAHKKRFVVLLMDEDKREGEEES